MLHNSITHYTNLVETCSVRILARLLCGPHYFVTWTSILRSRYISWSRYMWSRYMSLDQDIYILIWESMQQGGRRGQGYGRGISFAQLPRMHFEIAQSDSENYVRVYVCWQFSNFGADHKKQHDIVYAYFCCTLSVRKSFYFDMLLSIYYQGRPKYQRWFVEETVIF